MCDVSWKETLGPQFLLLFASRSDVNCWYGCVACFRQVVLSCPGPTDHQQTPLKS